MTETKPAEGIVLSIVAPSYNEMAGLAEFHRRASVAAQATVGNLYEIVLVDDGSCDGTWAVINGLAKADPRVLGLRLFRNYGHQAAASAGLAAARGKVVLLIDADLQDPPELLPQMMERLRLGYDVVYGQRRSRAGENTFKKLSAKLFYRLFRRLTAVNIPRDAGDFRLMTRWVIDTLSLMPERQRFIRGMVAWVGGRQSAFLYDRQPRFAGKSNYPLSKMIRFALDAITSFSAVPLRLAFYTGLIFAAIAVVLLVFTLWRWIAGETVAGWSSTMTAIVTFGALQLIFLGIIGEYLGRLFLEIKARPLYTISEVITKGRPSQVPVDFAIMTTEMRQRILGAAADG